MCEPTTLAYIAFAAAAAGAVAQHDQARSTGNKMADAAKRENELIQADLTRQSDQQDAAARAEMNAANRKAMQDAALFDVVAGEYGGGNSVDRARTLGNLQANENLATIAANARTGQSETGFRRLATLDQAQAKLAGINRPSVLGTALQIGGAAVNAYALKKAITPVDTTGGPMKVEYGDYNYRGTRLPNSLRGGQ